MEKPELSGVSSGDHEATERYGVCDHRCLFSWFRFEIFWV